RHVDTIFEILGREDDRESFDARSREFNTPETRVVEQITFADKEAAQKGFDALKGGKTFDALADEQGREDRFISYGDVASTAILDSALAKAAFTLKEPGFTEPVSGDLSTSILRVTKITPAVAQKFEDVKAQVRTELIQERAVTRVADLYDQIEDDRGKGLTLEDISSKRDVNLTEVAAVDSSGKAPDGTFVKELPQNPALQRGISGAEIDLNADPVELGGDSFAFVEVKAITPEKLRPFDEVKDDVTSAWRAAEERLSVTKAAEGAVDKLNGGAPIADVAKALEVEVKTADKLKRASRTDDLPSGAVGRLFSLAKGRAASAELLGGQNRVVFVVTDITTPDKPLDAVATLIENQVSNQIGEEMVAEYLQALQSRYDVEVDQEAIVQATDPAGPAGGRGSF
ncbi:MAG: peptidyl-prolyl cis-trans isomerase, partial [Pseudomonadota bacterium]